MRGWCVHAAFEREEGLLLEAAALGEGVLLEAPVDGGGDVFEEDGGHGGKLVKR